MATVHDTAFAGQQYSAINTVLTWDDGETGIKTIAIPIFANVDGDGDDDGDEKQFLVRISQKNSDGSLRMDHATVTIAGCRLGVYRARE